MVSIPNLIGIISCGAVLCLNLFNAPQAAESRKSDPCADRESGPPNLVKCDEIKGGIDTVKGNVLRVEFDNVVVRQSDGKEVRLHIDENTEMIGYVSPGEHIEAKVDAQKHALSIRRVE
ncbi:MAG: hypothetical protein ABI604_07135 [Nitrospirota bacterium]